MKKEVGKIDATPSKRTYHSIIADYDLNRSICELVDNGLDVWVREGKPGDLTIEITFNQQQQTITVADNAGGVSRAELQYIVAPGQTGTKPSDETIGIFGVGTKRAVIALAQEVKITTRHAKEATYRVEFDDAWIADDSDWKLPVYEVDAISPGSTLVELHKLRAPLTEDAAKFLREHLRVTYALFMRGHAVTIVLDGKKITPKVFDNWAYPPKYSPRRFAGSISSPDGYSIRVEAIAGLSRESSPSTGEYGVYFYCNNRLIARALKTFDVGFMKGLAGLPHAKVSLTRVLVFLNGDARGMPWNSSKSDINTKHEIFVALHGWLVNTVKGYASLSRIWVGQWPTKVFRYKTGAIEDVGEIDFPSAAKSYLPPLPKSRPRYADIITKKNQKIGKDKPWTIGLYEGVIAADFLFKQHLQQKNRLALVILDSTLEIAFKEFLVYDSGTAYSEARLASIFSNRHLVHDEVKKVIGLRPAIWKKIVHYYNLRCDLIHKKATAGITDEQINDFRDVVEKVLNKLYSLKFNT